MSCRTSVHTKFTHLFSELLHHNWSHHTLLVKEICPPYINHQYKKNHVQNESKSNGESQIPKIHKPQTPKNTHASPNRITIFSGGISAGWAISGAVNAFKIAVATSFRTAAVRQACECQHEPERKSQKGDKGPTWVCEQ